MDVRLLDDRYLWNAWVAGCPTGNILQSYEWGEFKALFGWKVLRVGLCDGNAIRAGAQLMLKRAPAGAIAYCPRGPIVDYDDVKLTEELFDTLHKLARREGASFLKIEPPIKDSPDVERLLANLGFHRSEEIQPRSTIIIDLVPDLEVLSANLNIKTRYNVGLACRRNVRILEGCDGDVRLFYDLLRQTSQRGDFSIHSADYYENVWRCLRPRGMAQLLLASCENEIVAATMIFVMGSHAYYMYGASSGKHRNLKPSDLLQWESIKWAKSVGCTSYDMWGIPDEVGSQLCGAGANGSNGNYPANGSNADGKADASASPLWGVYLFKRGFGGEVTRFIGAFDYVYSPVQHWLWKKALPFQRQLSGKLKKHQYAKVG